ncbi:hypothetical protein QTP70_033143, partial [Hemibagrus guttatus]
MEKKEQVESLDSSSSGTFGVIHSFWLGHMVMVLEAVINALADVVESPFGCSLPEHMTVSAVKTVLKSRGLPLPLNTICPLQMIQNAAARLVFNLPKFSHTTPLLRSLHWLPVAARIRFKTLILAYKAKNGPAPPYLKALITPRTAPRSLRSSSTARLVPPSLREK